MKKISILLVLVLLLTGCSKAKVVQENLKKTEEAPQEPEEPKEESIYYLPELQKEFDAIDKLTEDEVIDKINLLREPGSFGELGHTLYQKDLLDTKTIKSIEDPALRKEGLKAIIMSDKYNLDFSMPNPYTGQIFGELYAHDLEYFKPPEDSITTELLKIPLEERRHIPYRNYYDYLEEGKGKELASLYVEAWYYLSSYLSESDNKISTEARYYTIPELFNINTQGTYTSSGVLINRWPEDTNDNLKEILGDIVGDGNFYKHYVTFVYFVKDGEFVVQNMFIDPEDKYVTNLGPNYVPANFGNLEEFPMFIKYLFAKWNIGREVH